MLYLKIDVEGVELLAVEGADAVLNRCLFLMVEVTVYVPGMDEEARREAARQSGKVLDLLRGRGFTLSRLGKRGEMVDMQMGVDEGLQVRSRNTHTLTKRARRRNNATREQGGEVAEQVEC